MSGPPDLCSRYYKKALAKSDGAAADWLFPRDTVPPAGDGDEASSGPHLLYTKVDNLNITWI